ncbi:serpin family protein [Kipferlia bialata]|uniref:Serpin family protein n=1 Tax=Kipferlia bialata TaxID=797122 RepID=A0A9K3D1J1_9EUKA|nr:serpin family protein [Kipferlia bialata]|eukprot:g9348.t1
MHAHVQLVIGLALLMTLLGAEGETRAEMEKTLHLIEGTETLCIPGLMAHLESITGGASLSISNGLFPSTDTDLYPAYIDSLEGFRAAVESLDYGTDPEGCRQHINSLIGAQTQGMIPELLPPNSTPGNTKLVLTNAIHFMGVWDREFDKSLTRDHPFHVSEVESVPTPMMTDRDRETLYAEGDGWTAVEMPYADSSLAFTVYMPHDMAQTPDMSQGLWEEVRSSLSPTTLSTLSIPKFKTAYTLDATTVLQDIGMHLAFGSGAQFGLMSDKGLQISDVFHQAVIDVSEQGTEAAAATAVVMVERCMPIGQRPSFIADRPFLYSVTDTVTGMPLFTGRYMRPE